MVKLSPGADYMAVGRPIRTAPDPRAAAEEYRNPMGVVFES